MLGAIKDIVCDDGGDQDDSASLPSSSAPFAKLGLGLGPAFGFNYIAGKNFRGGGFLRSGTVLELDTNRNVAVTVGAEGQIGGKYRGKYRGHGMSVSGNYTTTYALSINNGRVETSPIAEIHSTEIVMFDYTLSSQQNVDNSHTLLLGLLGASVSFDHQFHRTVFSIRPLMKFKTEKAALSEKIYTWTGLVCALAWNFLILTKGYIYSSEQEIFMPGWMPENIFAPLLQIFWPNLSQLYSMAILFGLMLASALIAADFIRMVYQHCRVNEHIAEKDCWRLLTGVPSFLPPFAPFSTVVYFFIYYVKDGRWSDKAGRTARTPT